MAVLAQRLVRVVCSKCKQPHSPSEAALETAGITPEMASSAKFMKGKGCGHCSKSGYRGRIGIFELMMITNKIRELAFTGAPTQEIRRAALAQGMTALYHDGIRKVLNGTTTIEEVFRVSKKVDG
jgi:type IV pilus assembly protein PilB